MPLLIYDAILPEYNHSNANIKRSIKNRYEDILKCFFTVSVKTLSLLINTFKTPLLNSAFSTFCAFGRKLLLFSLRIVCLLAAIAIFIDCFLLVKFWSNILITPFCDSGRIPKNCIGESALVPTTKVLDATGTSIFPFCKIN